ncbi:MAG: HPr family phosphocarrier protein [Firmicutes bacterium]|nr:HPr family phosphocarrier protein [Bacillota bacterium]
MRTFDYTITDTIGMHARPAGEFVKLAKSLTCDVSISCGTNTADAKKLFAVMGLGISYQSNVTLAVTGANADEEVKILEDFFKSTL